MAWVPPLLNFVECALEEPICTSYTNYTTSPQSVDADDDISTKSSIVAAVAATVVKSDDTQSLSGWVPEFFDTVVPTYSLDTFRSHFQMSRTSFEVHSFTFIPNCMYLAIAVGTKEYWWDVGCGVLTCTERPYNIFTTFRNVHCVHVVSSSSGFVKSPATKYMGCIFEAKFLKWCYRFSHFIITCSF